MGPLRTCAFFVSVIAGVSTMYLTLSVNTYICASLHISLCVLFVCYMRMMWTCRCPATDCWPKQTVCLIWAVVPWEFAGVELQTTPPGDKRLSLLSTGAIPVGKDGLNSFQWKAAGALWCPERVVQEGARDVRCTWVVYKSRPAASQTSFLTSMRTWDLVQFSGEVAPFVAFSFGSESVHTGLCQAKHTM